MYVDVRARVVRVFAFLLVACADPKSPPSASAFGKQHLELFAQRIVECSGRDHDTLLWLLDIPSYEARVAHSVEQKRVVYRRELAAACLNDLASADCSDLAQPLLSGGSCARVLEGQVKVGDDCFELRDYEECGAKAFCNPLGACNGVCTLPVKVGGSCGAGTTCEAGSRCLKGICRANAELGAVCAGNTGVSCKEPYVCIYGDETKTGICKDALAAGGCRVSADGRDAGDCQVGMNCQRGDDPQTSMGTCQRSLAAGEECLPGRYQCAGYHACIKSDDGAYRCVPFGHENDPCGYYYSAEEGQFEFALCSHSTCDADTTTLSPENPNATGTCRALLGEGERCWPSERQCQDGLSCDAITETCVAGCPLQ